MPVWSRGAASAESADVSDDLRRIFHELDRQAGRTPGSAAGECTPSLDVLETDETVEIIVDLPGVDATSVRVVLKGALVLVAGEKRSIPPSGIGAGDFHLIERGFGRFARAVRMVPAVDGSRASVRLADGELRIVLPRIHERRGQPRVIPVEPDGPVRES